MSARVAPDGGVSPAAAVWLAGGWVQLALTFVSPLPTAEVSIEDAEGGGSGEMPNEDVCGQAVRESEQRVRLLIQVGDVGRVGQPPFRVTEPAVG